MNDAALMYAILWAALGFVNVLAGKKKGADVIALVVCSVIAAPLVYLYVLALPSKS